MKNGYGAMMERAFETYYARFRALGATSRDTAVTVDDLFPDGQTLSDREAMHKMLSMWVVKRTDGTRYYLNESLAAKPQLVLLQRIGLILIAVIGAMIYVSLTK